MNGSKSVALAELLPDIGRAAAYAARNWPGVIEADDAEQEITMALIGNGDLERVAGLTSDERWPVLRKLGDQTASRYRTDADYFSGQFFYSTRDVRSALESGALSSVRDKTNTERLDVDEGMSLLKSRNPQYAEAVELRYLLREPAQDRKLLTRAVDALTNAMNNVHQNRNRSHTEGPGMRPVISNEETRYLARRQG